MYDYDTLSFILAVYTLLVFFCCANICLILENVKLSTVVIPLEGVLWGLVEVEPASVHDAPEPSAPQVQEVLLPPDVAAVLCAQ
jgi:hypothetical protein